MKRCELCKRKAWVQCDADMAALCWDCDARVHSANFLVARHTRSVLCKVCDSVLQWSADGSRLTPIVSVCDQCAGRRNRGAITNETAESERGVVVDEEEEIHVVPSSPADSCSSSSSKHELGDGDLLRRSDTCSSSRKQGRNENNVVSEDLRKRRRTENDDVEGISIATTVSKSSTKSSKLLLFL